MVPSRCRTRHFRERGPENPASDAVHAGAFEERLRDVRDSRIRNGNPRPPEVRERRRVAGLERREEAPLHFLGRPPGHLHGPGVPDAELRREPRRYPPAHDDGAGNFRSPRRPPDESPGRRNPLVHGESRALGLRRLHPAVPGSPPLRRLQPVPGQLHPQPG